MVGTALLESTICNRVLGIILNPLPKPLWRLCVLVTKILCIWICKRGTMTNQATKGVVWILNERLWSLSQGSLFFVTIWLNGESGWESSWYSKFRKGRAQSIWIFEILTNSGRLERNEECYLIIFESDDQTRRIDSIEVVLKIPKPTLRAQFAIGFWGSY